MRITNDISVDAPPDELFSFLSDVERVAPCLPGAHIDGAEGDAYRGSMRVKVGPITADYRGTLRFLEHDEAARRAVLHMRADDAGGAGAAEARIATTVQDADGASRITIDTDLQIRGRVAQFGRGAMEKIATRMLGEFARNLEAAMSRREETPAREPERATAPAEATAPACELDAFGLLGSHATRRALRTVGVALIGFGYGYLAGRLRERSRER
jgi:carbon monoxide dehydrogenase subunit G